MKSKIIIALLISVSSCVSVYSQQDTLKRDEKNKTFKAKVKTSIKKIGDINFSDIDSLCKRIEYLESIERNLNDTIHKRDSIIAYERYYSDSLKQIVALRPTAEIESLRSEIEKQREFIVKLEGSIAYIDTVMVRLANDKLYGKYDEEKIDRTIKDFDRIYSTMIKKDFSQVRELLIAYKSSYNELLEILRDANEDDLKSFGFASNEYVEKYINRIKNMYYYRKYYSSDWSIIYLNKKIDEAIKLLENHNPPEKPVDFSKMLEELN